MKQALWPAELLAHERLRAKDSNPVLHVQSVVSCRLDDPGTHSFAQSRNTTCSIARARCSVFISTRCHVDSTIVAWSGWRTVPFAYRSVVPHEACPIAALALVRRETGEARLADARRVAPVRVARAWRAARYAYWSTCALPRPRVSGSLRSTWLSSTWRRDRQEEPLALRPKASFFDVRTNPSAGPVRSTRFRA